MNSVAEVINLVPELWNITIGFSLLKATGTMRFKGIKNVLELKVSLDETGVRFDIPGEIHIHMEEKFFIEDCDVVQAQLLEVIDKVPRALES